MGELAFLWLGKGGTGNDAVHTVALRTVAFVPTWGRWGRELVGTTADASEHAGCWAPFSAF